MLTSNGQREKREKNIKAGVHTSGFLLLLLFSSYQMLFCIWFELIADLIGTFVTYQRLYKETIPTAASGLRKFVGQSTGLWIVQVKYKNLSLLM